MNKKEEGWCSWNNSVKKLKDLQLILTAAFDLFDKCCVQCILTVELDDKQVVYKPLILLSLAILLEMMNFAVSKIPQAMATSNITWPHSVVGLTTSPQCHLDVQGTPVRTSKHYSSPNPSYSNIFQHPVEIESASNTLALANSEWGITWSTPIENLHLFYVDLLQVSYKLFTTWLVKITATPS